MLHIKRTPLYLFLLVAAVVLATPQPCAPAQIGTQHEIVKSFNMSDTNEKIIVCIKKNSNKEDKCERIGICTREGCQHEKRLLGVPYELSIEKKGNPKKNVKVKIIIMSVKQSDDQAVFTWKHKYKIKRKMRKCLLHVYDFNSATVRCEPSTFRRRNGGESEVLVSCHVSNVFPAVQTCKFMVNNIYGQKESEPSQVTKSCITPKNTNVNCTCNLTKPVLKGQVFDVSEVRFYFNISEPELHMINTSIKDTFPIVTAKNCSHKTRGTWQHKPHMKGGYCRTLELAQQIRQTSHDCNTVEDCPLCGNGTLKSEDWTVRTQIQEQKQEECFEILKPQLFSLFLYLNNPEDIFSNVDIAGLRLSHLTIERKEVKTDHKPHYFKIRLKVLPEYGKDIAVRVAFYSPNGMHSLVECHAPMYKACKTKGISTSTLAGGKAQNSTVREEKSTSQTWSTKKATQAGVQSEKTIALTTSTVQITSTAITTTLAEGSDTRPWTTDAKIQLTTSASQPLTNGINKNTIVTTSGRTGEDEVGRKAENAEAEDMLAGMETFHIILTSIPIVIVGVILIIFTICVVRIIRRRRYRRQHPKRRRKTPRSTKSDEDAVNKTVATTEEILTTDYAEVGDCQHVYANVLKPKTKDGGLKEGQYRNEEGLVYTTVDVVSCLIKNDQEDLKEKPVEYAILSFPKQ